MAGKSPAKDPITCHVLDTTTGRPAKGIIVTLRCLNKPASNAIFSATTNPDGRITSWGTVSGYVDGKSTKDDGTTVQDVLDSLAEKIDREVWTLRFDTGEYYGLDKTFWPEVELRFFVKTKGETYHVPLLLGPYSYTTYRGS
ncbi:transthyretin-like protein-like protein [Xylogone sp. PMI_703]|nr:transthyretin-like protein-like protein [Xylogone sp. PMI_703]